MSDGRPIIGLTSIQVAELVLTIEPKALIIPAHAWTPWFSIFGSMSGFNTIDEAFGPYDKHIYAVETGLSSNPSMNWRIKELDNRSIVSFSDAHSGPKIGREATVFDIPEGKLSYEAIYSAIKMTLFAPRVRNLQLRIPSNFIPKRESIIGRDTEYAISAGGRKKRQKMVLHVPCAGKI
jgi:PHP family Zn ribbon phosphoesterase